MLDRIAVAVDDPATAARDLAALTKRLAGMSRELDQIEPERDPDEEPAHLVAVGPEVPFRPRKLDGITVDTAHGNEPI